MNVKRVKIVNGEKQIQVVESQRLYLHVRTVIDVITSLSLLKLCGRHGFEMDEYVQQRKVLCATTRAVFYSMDKEVQVWTPSCTGEPPFKNESQRHFWGIKQFCSFILWKIQDHEKINLLRIFVETFLDDIQPAFEYWDVFSPITKIQWKAVMTLIDEPPAHPPNSEPFIALSFLQRCILTDIVVVLHLMKRDVKNFGRIRTYFIDTKVSDRQLVYDANTMKYHLPRHMQYEHGLDNPEIYVLNKQVQGVKTMYGTGDARNVHVFRKFFN